MKQKIFVGIIILALIAFLLPSILSSVDMFTKKKNNTSSVTRAVSSSTTTPSNSGITEPQFDHEGDLYIINKKDTVSKLRIEFADSRADKNRGLMFRSHMDADAGMLFKDDDAPAMKVQSFWMKNTYIPLDMIFLDDNQVIVDIAKNTVPYSERSVRSKVPARYVLEVNGGYSEGLGLVPGMQLSWVRH